MWLAIPVAMLTGLGVRMMVNTSGHASYVRSALTGDHRGRCVLLSRSGRRRHDNDPRRTRHAKSMRAGRARQARRR